MELTALPGDYGLASIDPDCLRLLAYAKFAGVPFELKVAANPLLGGPFPRFAHEDAVLRDFGAIVEYLRLRRYGLDFGLSGKRCSELMAFDSMAVRMLEPVSEYVFWADSRNYEKFTRRWYMNAVSFGFNLYYVKKRRERAFDLLKAHYPSLDNEAAIRFHIRNVALDCFTTFSARLGDSQYFYGNTPTTLDCTVYAYLAPIIKIPLLNNDIKYILRSFPKLMSFVKRISEVYFPNVKPEPVYITKPADPEDQAASTGLKIFTAAFVMCAMLGYAISNRIITLPLRSSTDEDFYYIVNED